MKIYSFSKSNQDMFRKLEDASEQIFLHLIKIFLYPDVQEQNHWKKEVWGFLPRVFKLKSTNRFPSKDQILKHTWSIDEDMLSELVELVMSNIIENPMDISVQDLRNLIWSYYDWMSTELSENGIIKLQDVVTKLSQLQVR